MTGEPCSSRYCPALSVTRPQWPIFTSTVNQEWTTLVKKAKTQDPTRYSFKEGYASQLVRVWGPDSLIMASYKLDSWLRRPSNPAAWNQPICSKGKTQQTRPGHYASRQRKATHSEHRQGCLQMERSLHPPYSPATFQQDGILFDKETKKKLWKMTHSLTPQYPREWKRLYFLNRTLFPTE